MSNCGIYIASAFDIENFASLPKVTKLSRSKILDRCIHFYQLFCDLKQDCMSIETVTNKLKELFSKKSALRSKLTEKIENNKKIKQRYYPIMCN